MTIPAELAKMIITLKSVYQKSENCKTVNLSAIFTENTDDYHKQTTRLLNDEKFIYLNAESTVYIITFIVQTYIIIMKLLVTLDYIKINKTFQHATSTYTD